MIKTRKSELRYTTSDPSKMLNMFTTRQVFKTWQETMVDEDGNKATVERNQILLDRGVYITNEVLAKIRFWIAEGSIKEIEVSNQNRMAYTAENTHMFPFRAVFSNEKKKHSYLLYAMSVKNALEVLNDFIELNYIGRFYLTDIKMLDYCVILVDKLKTVKQRNIELDIAYLNDDISMEEYMENKIEESDEDAKDEEADDLKLKFYQIGAKIITRLEDNPDEEYNQTFIVQTFSAVRANLIIEKYLRDQQEKRYVESLSTGNILVKKEIVSFIEESKIINVGDFIPRAFSEAYQED